MIQRNELRIQHYIRKLEKKLIEEYNAQIQIQQLELQNKLVSLYANDKEGYERALKISGLYSEPEKNKEKTLIHIVEHKPLRSKL